MGQRSEPLICVILPKEYPVFSSRREHAVRLLGAFGDKVINQDADICLITFQCERLFVPRGTCCVDSRHDALGCGFFVAGGAIDLACKKEVVDGLGFKAVTELCWVEKVILNRITRPEELHAFKPRHSAQGANLDILRQACAESVHIDFNGVPSFRLDK